MIELKDVHKRYWTGRGEAVWALRGVSATLAPKRNVALIGANGAGKSTLLRLIAGIDTPTRGKVRCARRVSWPIGVVSGLQGNLTGRQNTRFIARVQGFPESEIGEKIDFVRVFGELGQAFDQPVGSYSKGMRARLNFALSAAFEFDVYLVDEKMGGGGGTNLFKEKTRNAMKYLAEHADLIVASHNEKVVKSHCDCALWLLEGQAQWFDSVDEAWREHQKSLRRKAAA
jgi:capsular polysaccharide transport system ATP-binding protein